MAVKLDLRQRAISALGDYSMAADEMAIRKKMAELYAKDHTGEDETSLALKKALIERDGDLSALSPSPRKAAADSAPAPAPVPKKPGRGGRREGAGRPKSIKGALSVWSVRVTEDEKKALISALEKMRRKK